MNRIKNIFIYIIFSRYAIIFHIILLVLIVHAAYPYYEKHGMSVVHDTGWIDSPNGLFQVRVLTQRRLSLHTLTKIILRSRIDAENWFELMNKKIFEQLSFEFRPPHLIAGDPVAEKTPYIVKWISDDELSLIYHGRWTYMVPFELYNRYGCSLKVK